MMAMVVNGRVGPPSFGGHIRQQKLGFEHPNWDEVY